MKFSRKNIFFFLVIVFLALVWANIFERPSPKKKGLSPAQQQFDEHLKRYLLPRKSVVHRQFNFHIVRPGIWRSSQPNKASLALMKRHGLKTIINLRRDPRVAQWEESLAQRVGLTYYGFPMSSRKRQPDELLEKIVAIVRDPSHHPVLIHCHAGKDRTGMIVALYKIKYSKEPFDDIYKEMLMYGFSEEPHEAIRQTLFSWKEKYRNP